MFEINTHTCIQSHLTSTQTSCVYSNETEEKTLTERKGWFDMHVLYIFFGMSKTCKM